MSQVRFTKEISPEFKDAYLKIGARPYLHLLGDLHQELVSLCQRDSEHGLSFLQALLDRLPGIDDPQENDPIVLIKHLASEEDKSKGDEYLDTHPLGGIYLGCTYFHRADNANQLGLPTLCWNYIAITRYFLGIALAPNRSGVTYRALVNSLHLDGTKERGNTIDVIKKRAFDLLSTEFKERSENSRGRWESRDKATNAILGKVQKFAATKNWKQKRKNTNETEGGGYPSFRTVCDWLKEMPDAEKYFPVQKKKNKQDAE